MRSGSCSSRYFAISRESEIALDRELCMMDMMYCTRGFRLQGANREAERLDVHFLDAAIAVEY
jgi:hypothetical protein